MATVQELHEPRQSGLHSDPRRWSVLVVLCVALDHAVARGELAGDTDTALLADALVGTLYHRVVIAGEPTHPDLAARVVRQLLQQPALLANRSDRP